MPSGKWWIIRLILKVVGSGRLRGIVWRSSNLIDYLLQVKHSKLDWVCPLNRKEMNDQSLLRSFEYDSKPKSMMFLSSLSGLSMKGFDLLKLISSCKVLMRKLTNSCESYCSLSANCSFALPITPLKSVGITVSSLYHTCCINSPKLLASRPPCPITLARFTCLRCLCCFTK